MLGEFCISTASPVLIPGTRRSKLAVYLKETGIGSSRKRLMPKDVADQLVLDEMSTDPMMSRGPRDIKETLVL